MKKIILLSVIFFPFISYMLPDICSKNKKCLGNELYKWINKTSDGEKIEVDPEFKITKKNIVLNFCKTVYSFDFLPENEYKTKDSIFLALLCTSVGYEVPSNLNIEPAKLNEKALKYFEDIINESKKKSGFCIKEDGILTDPDSMDNVDFACVSKKAFKMVSTDMVNMATFIAYGGYESDEKRKKWEADFFAGEGTICPDSYISSEEKEEWYCKHPETLKQITEQNKELVKMIKNLKSLEIEPDGIYELFSSSDKPKKPGGVLLGILDRAYTELYFYGLFTSYYSNLLRIFNTYVSLKKVSSNVQEIIDLNGEGEIIKANENLNIAKQTLYKSFDVVKNIYSYYPVHLAYLMLIEDLIRLRKSISMLYTPLDQLRYKLEQAQDEDNP